MQADGRGVPHDAELIRMMRDASGLGMMDCKAALAYAREHLDGDVVVALLMRDAHGLAVNVRSRDPAVSDAEARRRWDENRARGRRADTVERGGRWAELDRISRRFRKSGVDL